MKTKQYDIGVTFNIPAAKGQEIIGYEPGATYVPKAEAHYVFDKVVLRDLMVWWRAALEGRANDGMYLFGPTGCGKSSAFVNFCALLNIPLYEKTVYEGMEFDVLTGRTEIVGGDTVFCYGVIPLAMGVTGEPGLLLINEVDRADDAILTGLYEVLAGRPLVLDANGHDVIEPQAGFVFSATGNTNMAGASSDYMNAKQQDMAFVDRFTKVEVGYPAPEVEEGILAKVVPNLNQAVAKKMVELANDIRRLHTDGDRRIPLTMSTRSLLRWARLTMDYHFLSGMGESPLAYSLDRTLLNVADRPTRAAIQDIAQLKFGVAFESAASSSNGGSSND